MPRAAQREQRRAEIVAAAARLIAMQGPDALSMRKIAAEAGCTIGLLNHWFDGKDELIEAVLEHASSAAVVRSHAATDDPSVTLEDVLLEFLPLDEERTHELRVWLVFWALSIGKPHLRVGHARRVAGIRNDFKSGLTERAIVTRDVDQFVDALMATLDGIAVNAIADPDYWNVERQTDTLRWTLARLLAEQDDLTSLG